MAGPDRIRLSRDSLGLGLSEMLQTQASLLFRFLHEGQRREGMGMGSKIESGRCGPSNTSQGFDNPGEPQEPLETTQSRVTMSEVFGRSRGRGAQGDEGQKDGPSVSMGEVFGRVRPQPRHNDLGSHLTPGEGLSGSFGRLQRTTLSGQGTTQDVRVRHEGI